MGKICSEQDDVITPMMTPVNLVTMQNSLYAVMPGSNVRAEIRAAELSTNLVASDSSWLRRADGHELDWDPLLARADESVPPASETEHQRSRC